MKAVMPELAPTSDSLGLFADLVHKKSNHYEVFRFMDTDNSNSISLAEFISHCANMKIGLPNDTVKEIFLQISEFQR
jgi:Ca2+-binding EF-hand superfamily protein